MPRSSRRPRPHLLDKQAEISRSLQEHWVACVLLGPTAVLSTLSLALAPSLLRLLIEIPLIALLVSTCRGLKKVRELQRLFVEDPTAHAQAPVPKTFAVHVLFWLPR